MESSLGGHMELSLTTEYRHLQAFLGPKTGLMINSTCPVSWPLFTFLSTKGSSDIFLVEGVFRQELAVSAGGQAGQALKGPYTDPSVTLQGP